MSDRLTIEMGKLESAVEMEKPAAKGVHYETSRLDSSQPDSVVTSQAQLTS